jgi:nucleoside-diphosphate-sugar epimerase
MTARWHDACLVTAESGLIGSHMLGLIKQEADIVALSRFRRADEGDLRWLLRDLAQPGAVADTVTSVRPEVVIHLAREVRAANNRSMWWRRRCARTSSPP